MRATDTQSARVFMVFGPTGSGKTELAVRLARQLGTEVVNTDPAQCYRGFPILTNQPTDEHDVIARHRLVGIWDVHHHASAGGFASTAHACIDELVHERGRVVLCGGSGLYARSALSHLAFSGPHRGSDGASGIWSAPYRHPTRIFGLHVDRSDVRKRIGLRTTAMFERGVLDEVAAVVGPRAQRLPELSRTARVVHGLDDCAGVLDGRWDSATAQDKLTLRTRQYVRRQDVWARKWRELELVSVDLARADAHTWDALATLLIE